MVKMILALRAGLPTLQAFGLVVSTNDAHCDYEAVHHLGA